MHNVIRYHIAYQKTNLMKIIMGVFTKIQSDDLAAFLSEAYALGDFFRMAGIQTGSQNTNYWLRTSEGEFVFTLFERNYNLKTIDQICNLSGHLKEQGVKIPSLVKTKEDEFIGYFNGKPSVITRFIHGYTLSPRNITEKHCTLAGKELATLHNASQSFKMPITGFYNKKQWPHILEIIDANIDNLEAPHKQQYQELKNDFLTIHNEWPKDKEHFNIHGDLFPDNVLFIDDLLTGVIDFNFADFENPTYDLAILLLSWSFDDNNDFNIERFISAAKSYAQHSPFWQLDYYKDIRFYLRAAALRSVLSRFYDMALNNVAEGKTALDPTIMINRYIFMKKNSDSIVSRLLQELSL